MRQASPVTDVHCRAAAVGHRAALLVGPHTQLALQRPLLLRLWQHRPRTECPAQRLQQCLLWPDACWRDCMRLPSALHLAMQSQDDLLSRCQGLVAALVCLGPVARGVRCGAATGQPLRPQRCHAAAERAHASECLAQARVARQLCCPACLCLCSPLSQDGRQRHAVPALLPWPVSLTRCYYAQLPAWELAELMQLPT